MGSLLAFAPFIAFVVVERFAGTMPGLISAALISAILLGRGWMRANRGVKVLELGSVLLFGGLAILASTTGSAWSIADVRLRVDLGLLLIVLVSLAIRKPFTIQYAREQAPMEMWTNPGFIRANYIITAAWAVAFAVIVGADFMLVFLPDLPHSVPIGATILALFAASRFTSWYPDHNQVPGTN